MTAITKCTQNTTRNLS